MEVSSDMSVSFGPPAHFQDGGGRDRPVTVDERACAERNFTTDLNGFDDMKSVLRKLQLRFHPDRNKDNEALATQVVGPINNRFTAIQLLKQDGLPVPPVVCKTIQNKAAIMSAIGFEASELKGAPPNVNTMPQVPKPGFANAPPQPGFANAPPQPGFGFSSAAPKPGFANAPPPPGYGFSNAAPKPAAPQPGPAGADVPKSDAEKYEAAKKEAARVHKNEMARARAAKKREELRREREQSDAAAESGAYMKKEQEARAREAREAEFNVLEARRQAELDSKLERDRVVAFAALENRLVEQNRAAYTKLDEELAERAAGARILLHRTFMAERAAR